MLHAMRYLPLYCLCYKAANFCRMVRKHALQFIYTFAQMLSFRFIPKN